MASPWTLVLLSSDGQRHQVSRGTARIFRALETMIESLGTEPQEPIPLPNVTGRILAKMLAWSEQHVMQMSPVEVPSSPITSTAEVPVQPVVKTKVPKRQPQLPPPDVVPTPWEREFLEKNRNDLYELLLAANYLDAKRLMDILCAKVADLIKGKNPETIRKTFHVPPPQNEET